MTPKNASLGHHCVHVRDCVHGAIAIDRHAQRLLQGPANRLLGNLAAALVVLGAPVHGGEDGPARSSMRAYKMICSRSESPLIAS